MPILAAEDLGLFDEAGLDVTTSPGGGVELPPARGGWAAGHLHRADGRRAHRASGRSADRGRGHDQQKSPYGLIVAPDRQITAPADLKGHPIGVHPFDPQYAMWKAFEAANGIGDGDVSEVTVSFGPEPLYEGQVDAIPNFLSLLPALVGQHYGQEPVTFLFADHGAWAGGQTIVANRDWATANPEAVTAFLDAYRKAMAWGLEGTAAAIDLVVSRYPDLDREIVPLSCPRSWASGSRRTRTPTAYSPCPMRCGSARTRCSATTAT